MITLIAILNIIGLTIAGKRRYGFANPFQVYFFIASFTFTIYALTEKTWYPIGFDVKVIFIYITVYWLALFVISGRYISATELGGFDRTYKVNKTVFRYAFALVLLGLPLLYARAQDIIGSASLFSVSGFTNLRRGLSPDAPSYGVLAYLTPLSMVLSAVSVVLFVKRELKIKYAILSIAISLAYCYLSTGRTFILLLACMILGPSALAGKVRFKGAILIGAFFLSGVIGIAALTSKGINAGENASSNVDSFLQSSRSYTVAPLIAFSNKISLFEARKPTLFGEHVFRTWYAILHAMSIIKSPPPQLVQEFSFVPDATNVYTVYQPYVIDFGYFGFVIVALFPLLHIYLYRRARMHGAIYSLLYSAMLYPLLMQFFQDQYFSLMSQWIQLVLWSLLLTTHIKLRNQRPV